MLIHAFITGSQAIDEGDNSQIPTTADQRGLPRIVNITVGIGSFEVK